MSQEEEILLLKKVLQIANARIKELKKVSLCGWCAKNQIPTSFPVEDICGGCGKHL